MKKKQIVRQKFNEECLTRDEGFCKVCKERATEVHHILDRRFLPDELKYVKDNGISLCNDCHRLAEKFHQAEGKSWSHGLHPDDLYFLIRSTWRTSKWPELRTSYYEIV